MQCAIIICLCYCTFVCCRYNSLNQLSCLVCGIQIKNELLWTTHLHSKKHKDAVLILKSSKSSTASQQPQPAPQQKEEGFLKPQAPPTSKRKTSEVYTTVAVKGTRTTQTGDVLNLPASITDLMACMYMYMCTFDNVYIIMHM